MAAPLSVAEYQALARRRLPRFVMDYLDGGAEDERGLKRNRDAFSRLDFAPRRLQDISVRSTQTRIVGSPVAAPMVVGPTGLNGLYWRDADVCLARAAGRAGLAFALSTASNNSIEAVADHASGELWFQLYVIHETLADQLVSRALAAGYRTLIVTVDVQLNGRRERDLRNGFGLPFRYTPKLVADAALHPGWAVSMLRRGPPQMANLVTAQATDPAAQAALLARQMDASFGWRRLEALRDRWPHRLIVKGLMRPDDVTRCFSIGVDGVVLSNHGGRQLDDAASPLEVLDRIREPNGDVLIDGGVRRGSDVVKALALGAKGVLLGRAPLYGLAVGGEEGAFAVLEMLKAEIDLTLAQLGVPAIADLNRDLVFSGDCPRCGHPGAAPAEQRSGARARSV